MRERKKMRTHESKVNGGENGKVRMRMSEKQAYCLSKCFTNTTQGYVKLDCVTTSRAAQNIFPPHI